MLKYAHSPSKLFCSLQKNKQKLSTHHHKNITPQSIKESIQKVKQIGQDKYKTAMKHMEKFNKYNEEMKQRKIMQNQFIDSQCTFKPKINKKKKYNNLTPRYMLTSYTERYVRNQDLNPQIEEKKQEKGQKMREGKRKHNVDKWSQNNELKRLNKTIQYQVRRSSQRIKSTSSDLIKKKEQSLNKPHQSNHKQSLNKPHQSNHKQSLNKPHQSNHKQSLNKPHQSKIVINKNRLQKDNKIDEMSYQEEYSQQMIENEQQQMISVQKRLINSIQTINQTKRPKSSPFTYNNLFKTTKNTSISKTTNNTSISKTTNNTSISKINLSKVNQSRYSLTRKSNPNLIKNQNIRKLYTQNISLQDIYSPILSKLQQTQNHLPSKQSYSKYSQSYSKYSYINQIPHHQKTTSSINNHQYTKKYQNKPIKIYK